jgi:hypothetical protein
MVIGDPLIAKGRLPVLTSPRRTWAVGTLESIEEIVVLLD